MKDMPRPQTKETENIGGSLSGRRRGQGEMEKAVNRLSSVCNAAMRGRVRFVFYTEGVR